MVEVEDLYDELTHGMVHDRGRECVMQGNFKEQVQPTESGIGSVPAFPMPCS